MRNLGFGRIEYFTLSILLLASPLYIYWSRTVMIESCALFFGLAWLAFLIQYLRTRVSRDACIAIVLGVVAINAKLTTFATLGIIGGITVLATAYRMFQSGLTERDVRVILTAAIIGFVPFATGLAWITYADHVQASEHVRQPFDLSRAIDVALWHNAAALFVPILAGHDISRVSFPMCSAFLLFRG